MAVKLSKNKEKWAKQFKPEALKGSPIANNASISEKYHKDIQALVSKMTKDMTREVLKFYGTKESRKYFAEDASVASQARILMNRLEDKFNGMFGDAAKVMAERMIKNTDKSAKSSVTASLKDLSGLTISQKVVSADLQETFKASIAENVDLIKSIPQEYLKQVKGAVYRSITSGTGLGDLVPALKKYEGMTNNRAKMIALDQTRKAYQSITADRLKKSGIKKFEWVHSAGGRFPRQVHMNMNGNIYSYDDLPIIDQRTGQRGLPGDAVNCRCVQRPIVEFDSE